MRTEVRMCFDVSEVPGSPHQFLALAGLGPDVAKVDDAPVLGVLDAWVTLEESDRRVEQLKDLLRKHSMTWLEWHEDRYTDAEMDAARLIVLHPPWTYVIDGGVSWGTTFDLTGACPVCATGCRQTSAWFINGEEIPKLEGHRVVESEWTVLVDEGIASALEDAAVTGLSFRSVYAVMQDKRQVKLRWKQLCADNVLPPMSRDTTGFRRIVQSEKVRACDVCGRNGYLPMREMSLRPVYRASDLCGTLDINSTWENYWGSHFNREDFRQSILSRPWLIATPKVYRIFRDAGVTELEYFPIRVEDG